MEQVLFKSDDLLVMNLINYFITEEDYNPMIIHGLENEIWLENQTNDYKIIRIVPQHIHNKEQYDFDKFKLNKIVKQVKRKTLSLKMNVLSIYMDVEDKKLLHDDDVLIRNEKDIEKTKLRSIFPNIVEKTTRKEQGLEYFIKVTDSINKKNESRMKTAEKIFSYKVPIITYLIIGICTLLFLMMYIFGNGSTDIETLLNFGAGYTPLIKNGEYYRLFTLMFLHIGIVHLLCNMYSLYVIGTEIENIFGKGKYLIIYIVSGLCGSLLGTAFSNNAVMAGASGAIFGLLGALLYFGYYYRTYLGVKVRSSVIPVILINLFIGFTIPGISNAAHIGGLIGGVLTSMMVGVEGKSNKIERINGIVLTVIYIAFISYLCFR